MFIDQAACEAFWLAYLAQLPTNHPHQLLRPDAFGFAGESALADELAALVLSGRKRATTSLPIEYTSLGEGLPAVGALSVIVRGDGRPVALIERTHVASVPFCEVDEAYASVEGEGDGSLDYWREGHARYFRSVCSRIGGEFTQDTPVLCQVFRVIWRSS